MIDRRTDDASASSGDERDTRDVADSSPTLRERLRDLDLTVLGMRIARMWRRSLQLRVVTSTLALSMGVILTIAFMLQSQMAAQLLSTKLDAAVEQTGRLRVTVEAQIAATDEGTSEQSRLDQARSALGERGIAAEGESVHAGTFEPILVVPDQTGRGQVVSPADARVPADLQALVQRGLVAQKIEPVVFRDEETSALIIGTPTDSSIPGLELYLVYPLIAEEQTLGIMRGIVATAGLAIIVLSAAIAWMVARQVVLPVRQAASIAQRFANGHLKERMVIRGEDDVARLAMAFNDMAQSLSDQITQLEEFGDLQKRFTSDVSHELRTPLTTVRMAADIISDSAGDLDPPTKRAVELLESELDRFESLLTDLLEVSRHDAGMAELSVASLDVRGAVEDAVSTVSHIAESAGVQVELDMPSEPVMAEVDSRRVERILRNLIANALDHSESKPVRVTLRGSEAALAVSVRDHGVGLKPGEESLVFNRFWRADPSRVRRSGGTGLGLAIALEDAKLHGGRLDCWGSPGEGSCFRLTIPRRHGGTLTSSPLPLTPEDEARLVRTGSPTPLARVPGSEEVRS
ncbi:MULTISPECIES: MtrAB system histidine kinase MtrB [unclassified Dietzia]|uniref:MtrAB system histidine kinase MtrB n=1 Tax=unclassified Dietzia TaxID=2617939 RepID=UPI000D209B1E|nr:MULTISPECIES: MtrAB system histidine kinase MtrB [unclassified Dietzia]AVZ38864.1 two-component sensor histidine kinase [Dietzia sp. JS16-p6b]MBB1024768.1 HAMP domain-containing histidine kinase [Dietzia sp. DQ12-76]MBB1027725.1 HAMP domain-containing histidine kinase [Dietzia sp. DQ11-38-2]QGW23992.1 ATP-binding region ATPase domain-containing protein [Dietzia sp. DQ12-45-1b]